PRARVPGVSDRIIEAGVGWDPRQQRRLGERELLGRLVEVDPRRLLDAVRSVAEVDRVQVRGQDPLLLPALLELPGERRLAHLPPERPLAPHAGVLDELLRDRRAALDDAFAADVRPERAHDAANVDAAVLVEAPVLGRDDGLLHPGRDLIRVDEDAILVAAQDGEDRLAVARVDVAVLLLVAVRRIARGKLAGDRTDQPERERGRPEQAENENGREEAQLANAPVPLGRGADTTSQSQN